MIKATGLVGHDYRLCALTRVDFAKQGRKHFHLQRHAARVRDFGIEYGSEELITQQIPCTEKRAWEYTALAMLLAEANGAYCLQTTPETFVFMTFGEVDLKKRA